MWVGYSSGFGKLAGRGVSRHLSVAHLNIRSLNTGFDEMRSLVCDFDFDVFAVSETWLHPDTPSENYKIPGYTILRKDRAIPIRSQTREDVMGGGVALYIKDGISHEQYQIIEDVDSGIEALCIVLKTKRQRIGLCVLYRPPSVRYTSLSALFHSLFVNLAIEVNSVVCLGDLNIDLASKTCSESKYLRRLLKESNAIQLIDEPTRVTATSATLLDHIIVDRIAEVKRIGVIDTSSITDHRGVKITDHKLIYCILECNIERKPAKLITYRDFSKFNSQDAICTLEQIDWEQSKAIQSVDEIEQFVTSKIQNVYDNQAPIVCRKVTRKKAPWKNHLINDKLRTKMKLRNKFWRTRANADWEQYKLVRNELNSLIWSTKKKFFTDKLGSNKNPKDLWANLKQCDILNDKSNDVIPDNLTVDAINRYFVDMGSGCHVSDNVIEHFETTKKEQSDITFDFNPVTEHEVISVMNEIKSKAVGSDNLSIQMIKAVSPFAIGAITHLMNRSLEVGTFPTNWKISIVRPLGKVAAPKSVQQLRPISILPAISKILEKIVLRQIIPFIDRMKILPEKQSGFRKSHSTCTALVNLFSDLIDAKDEGKYSSLVMLDYSQAFDSMNHNLLVAKMHYYSFSEKTIEWVRSYLQNRVQITKVGNETSAALMRKRGVPQGSCLGPVLFNLFTSDFPSCVKNCTVHQYADDCQLHLSYVPSFTNQAIVQINEDLNAISRWSSGNGLKLNVGKCIVLHLAPPNIVQALSDVMLDGESLVVRDSVKTLGVVLDGGLAFSEHVTHSIQRAVGRLRGLYRYRSLLPESVKLQLMQSLVLSVFYYCYPAYGNSISKEDSQRIQRIQNTAIRYVFSLRRFDHVSSFRDEINMLPMEITCRILTSCMTHKALTLGEPQYLCERLMYRDEVSQRSTRHNRLLHFRRVRLEVGRKSFSYFGPKTYNDLPECLKNCLSDVRFKIKLKKMLLDLDRDRL